MHDIGFKPRRGAEPGRGGPERPARLDRCRLAQPAGPLADAGGARSRAASASTRSTRCSRTCSSCTATRARTGSRGSRRPSSPAPRSWAASWSRGSAGCSRRRTDALLIGGAINVGLLVLIGWTSELRRRAGAAHRLGAGLRHRPVRCARRSSTACIPSEQRATVLSFDSLMGSTGGVVIPAGPRAGRRRLRVRARRTSSRPGFSALSLPFIVLARRERAPRT